jgi:hypothetical protein
MADETDATPYRPGSAERIEVYRRRALAKLPLWHRQDSDELPGRPFERQKRTHARKDARR